MHHFFASRHHPRAAIGALFRAEIFDDALHFDVDDRVRFESKVNKAVSSAAFSTESVKSTSDGPVSCGSVLILRINSKLARSDDVGSFRVTGNILSGATSGVGSVFTFRIFGSVDASWSSMIMGGSVWVRLVRSARYERKAMLSRIFLTCCCQRSKSLARIV